MTVTVYTKQEINILKRQLKDGIKKCQQAKEMDTMSWGYELGVLISGNDAKYILSLIEKL